MNVITRAIDSVRDLKNNYKPSRGGFVAIAGLIVGSIGVLMGILQTINVTTGLKWNHFNRIKRNHFDLWAHYGVSVLR